MYCGGCGHSLTDGLAFCPQCGRPVSALTSTEAQTALPATAFQRKLRALGFCWIAYGALLLIWMGAIQILHPEAMDQGAGAFLYLGLLSWVDVFLGIAAGIGLLNLQSWGRSMAIAAAILALPSISFPIGTVIGIWTLVVILNRENAAAYRALCSVNK